MEVICLEEPAFYKLIEKVVDRLKDQNKVQEDEWLSGEEAMQKLRINSKTTLFKIRDEGKITCVYASPRVILYSASSINEYLKAKSIK
ncbi:DNA-binding protein [Mucilaginibacter celer]|uniref:DNA-binding protein n=1 Tax=Mucilaginibacter celer TaxID=2305508 RepID=A0A494W0B1_9SPHI|nr:DNA-binding protein [Mucilaginibacter celer]AYL96682.1 DNA-binding protein [Mucilaginibacter celer]